MAVLFHYGGCFFSINGRGGVSRVRRRAVAAANSEEYGKLEEKVKLGGSEVKVSRLGIGAWSWGDNIYWNWNNCFQWDDRKLKAAKAAFNASIDHGITFIDTAEIYGAPYTLGAINSETLVGRFIKEKKGKDPGFEVTVATKFAVLPWRLGRQSVISVLKDSLYRLGLESVDLYQLHWPGIWGNEEYIDGLGDAVEQGLVKAVGVSNYNEKRLRDAYEKLKKRGIPLASNQVNYSLIYRAPEENGVKDACDELGVTLIAYAPLAQGVLTGKYTATNPPIGPRSLIYSSEFVTKLQPLLNRIRDIGEKYNKSPTQVVLNWLIAQENVVPIPGAKNAEQAIEFVGALGWRISNEEINELRSLASKLQPVFGLPFEIL
ncbi:uncharacterized oxidoreductase At1g06690, chloroplastic-like isoform X2 [Benincasa hispida]|uniref:uncharacterized oxidoreductase At1g06690, chloroplastic-like isoform X2 n=1 Tax=Benincasa hispida TaxID=102211 RepID=UPI001902A69C|nr:uncharacterized oxidoreductase At1g06690, chloroplastic-like isoform X2 [Benincasa hispida]